MGDEQTTTNHQLWISLSSLGDGNIFAVLPQLMRKMLSEDGPGGAPDESFDLILPSDDVWQTKIYYKLVEKQRIADALQEGDEGMFNPEGGAAPTKLHDWIIIPKPRNLSCDQPLRPAQKKPKQTPTDVISWTVGDIAKAGRLLTRPPLVTDFEDEHEMRRVYTLIYDVFRHKSVLTQALNDIAFFGRHPQLFNRTAHVWLLFYDLYHRSFKERETNLLVLVQALFEAAGLVEVEQALWQQRVKLAAAVSRLRIQHNALSLTDLLPPNLRADKVTGHSHNNPVTCWVNTKKVRNPESIQKQISLAFNVKLTDDQLEPGTFKWDRHCPSIISFHPTIRSELAKNPLVKQFKLVVQDKAFCLGPATFTKLVTEMELAGSVVQTHVNSPRTTAYLANILATNEKIKKLMAFSAGTRKTEYESYFSALGMTNIVIFSDRFIDLNPDAHYMEEVVAVFATPPNSYSAVSDPIDLVCSRGGDLSMLEVLTESEETTEGRDRVGGILDEQRRTLKFAMSRPQIQFVLYETHSELDVENNNMVARTVTEMNRLARLRHAISQGKILDDECPQIEEEINNNEQTVTSGDPEGVDSSEDVQDRMMEHLLVPNTDLFESPDLPNLCSSSNSCIDLTQAGCFLALLQRKQVIRLDNKYMIQMAENRGLFGSNPSNTSKSKGSKGRKKQERPSTPPHRTKRRIKDEEICRITAPTHTFLCHTNRTCDKQMCPRCRLLAEKPAPQVYKGWWSQTTRHLATLKQTLIKNKVIPPAKGPKDKINGKSVVDGLSRDRPRIDEIVAASRDTKAPLYPRLRLPRDRNNTNKVQVILSVTKVG